MDKLEKIINYIFAVLQWCTLVVSVIAFIFVLCGFDYPRYKILNCFFSSVICYLVRWVIPTLFMALQDYRDNK